MKKIAFILLVLMMIAAGASGQILKGAGIIYFDSLTNVNASTSGAEIAFSIKQKALYKWNRTTSEWDLVVKDTSAFNELQVLYKVGDTLYLTDQITGVSLKPYKNRLHLIATLADTTSITDEVEGDVAYITGGDTLAFRDSLYWLPFFVEAYTDPDPDPTNELQEIDTLTLSGNTLNASLSNDGVAAKTVDLSPLLTGYISGSLTAGRIPRATAATTIADGVLRDDGTLLALGGATVSGYSFYDYSTGGWRLATGTTAQRPTNAAGVHRYNTSLGYSETANGSAWLQSDLPNTTQYYTLVFNGTSWVGNSRIMSDGSRNLFNNSITAYMDAASTFGMLNASSAGAPILGIASTGWDGYWAMNTDGSGKVRNGETSTYSGNNYPGVLGAGVNDSYYTRYGNIVGTAGISSQTAAGNQGGNYVGVLGQANVLRSLVASSDQHIGVQGVAASVVGDLGTTVNLIGVSGTGINYSGGAGKTTIGILANASAGDNNWGIYSQSGLNGFDGSVIIDPSLTTTSTAARTLHVTGEARITDLTTDTPTRIVGADADGDLGAVTLGSGLSLSAGTLSATAATTLYTGDGTIATDRTVTINDGYGLILTGTPGVLSFTETSGYIGSLSSYGFYKEIADTAYYLTEAAIKQPGSSTVFQVVAGRQDASTMATLEVNGDGGASVSSLKASGESGVVLDGGTATYNADVSHINKIGSTTIHTTTSTGLGINDTSPEKSLDVGGMGKFRQLSGQDNSVTIGTNANMGTGRSASITDSQSSDVAGRISFTSGTTLTAGEWVTLTWGTSFDNAPAVQLFPENANAASITPYLFVQPSTTGCSIQVNVTGVPYEGLTFEFNYITIQGK